MSLVVQKDVATYMATIENFRTLARKTQDELLNPNVGNEAYNLRFDETYGTMEKRKNRSRYGSMSSLGTARVISAYRYYKNSNDTKYQLVAYSTTLQVGNDSAGTFAVIKSGLTANKRFSWITYKDLCYAFNGTDTSQVYNGTACNDIGVPIPTAPTLAIGAATGLTGAYYYKVTYELDSYQEGSASVASAVINPSNEKVTVTIPVSANTRVTARTIYRTTAGGAIYYYLIRVANNTDTTYTDSIADGSLDTTITAPTDYGAPGIYKYGCLHKSRIFQARNPTNKSRVIYCDVRSGVAYPDVYPALNDFDILRDNGEEVTFIGEDNYGQLIGMKPSAIVKINTDTDDPVGWSGFNSVISINGCIAPYSPAKTHIGLIYLSRHGEFKKRLMLWNGASAQPIFEELEPILSAIFDTKLNDVVGYYYNSSYLLSFNDDTDETTYNNRLLIIDLLTGTWVIDKKNIDCFAMWNSSNDWGELYTGASSGTGYLIREDTDVATQNDMIIDLKSELDLGTFSQCQTGGTEVSPTLTLIEAQLADDIGATIVSVATGIVSTYDVLTDNETVAPSCTYTSPVYEVNAKSFSNLYWNVVLGTGGHVRFWIRTGDTSADCQTADWSGPYSSSGQDLSSFAGTKYIQYMCKLYVEVTTNASGTYLYKDDYVVKITFGYGTVLESAIAMEYIGHWDDFGWVSPSFKRLRKRMRAVKIEFDRTAASGTLTFGYYLDGSTSRTDVDFSFADIDPKTGYTYATQGYIIYPFPLGVYFNKWKHRFWNNDDDTLKIKRATYVLSAEPYFPGL